jgi:hypothetical protein
MVMTPFNVIFIPVPVAGQVWSRRTPQPKYPSKRQETWPLTHSIPTQETRRQLDSARATIARDREQIAQLARQRVS